MLSILLIFSCTISACNVDSNESETSLQNTSQEDLVSTTSKQEDIVSTTRKNDIKDLNATGYSDGGLQRPFLYYDGQLYAAGSYSSEWNESEKTEDNIKRLNLGFLGSTVAEQNHEWPSKDLVASRIPVDSPVYLNKENNSIYVLYEDGFFYLTPYYDDLYPLGVD